MASKRKTKIICTIGPAVSDRKGLEGLARTGMNIARLNFSHGDHADFARIIADLRSIEMDIGRPIGILGDVQGPKLRVGKLAGGELELKEEAEVWITVEPIEGGIINGEVVIPTAYKDFVKDVGPGHTVLLEDGLMCLKVEARENGRLRCRVVNGGLLKDNKGINVPEASFSAAAITEKDYGDILFCMEQGVDFVALSFVRTAQEVRHLKHFIQDRGKRTQVIAKIEKQEALTNLEDIIDASDGVLLARGDLAVEVGNEMVPVLQKKVSRKAHVRGKPIIIATQMLMSMVESPRPSRAEASDVATAVMDNADAIMLSNETAVGKYPLEALQMMSKISHEAESLPYDQPVLFHQWEVPPEMQDVVAILQSAVRLAKIVRAKMNVVITDTGNSALLLSKCRPHNPVVAITGNLDTYRQLSMKWGVDAIFMEDITESLDNVKVFQAIGQRLLALNLVGTGDKIVITAGLPRLAYGSTNTLKIHQI